MAICPLTGFCIHQMSSVVRNLVLGQRGMMNCKGFHGRRLEWAPLSSRTCYTGAWQGHRTVCGMFVRLLPNAHVWLGPASVLCLKVMDSKLRTQSDDVCAMHGGSILSNGGALAGGRQVYMTLDTQNSLHMSASLPLARSGCTLSSLLVEQLRNLS